MNDSSDEDDLSRYLEADSAPPSLSEVCELNGHSFEGNDETSEFCTVCGLVREYASRENGQRDDFTRSDEIHVCWTAGDHVFGFSGVCMYCGKSEAALTNSERELHSAIRQERRADHTKDNFDLDRLGDD